jgi:hypothetical protein
MVQLSSLIPFRVVGLLSRFDDAKGEKVMGTASMVFHVSLLLVHHHPPHRLPVSSFIVNVGCSNIRNNSIFRGPIEIAHRGLQQELLQFSLPLRR